MSITSNSSAEDVPVRASGRTSQYPTRVFDVRLSGGLGNQLFQVAFALYLQRKFGGLLRFTDATTRYSARRALDIFKVLQLPQAMQAGSTSVLASVLHNFRIGRASTPLSINDHTAKRMLGCISLAPARLPYLIDGYFQDCWGDDALRSVVELVKSYALGCTPSDHTVVHIRGGDFLNIPKYQIAGLDFYQHAFRLLEDQFGSGAREIAVLTDDRAYAASLLSKCELPRAWAWHLVGGSDIVKDFQTLRGAAYRIAGNSTFSWWASALGVEHSRTLSTTHWTRDRAKRYRLPHETLIS